MSHSENINRPRQRGSAASWTALVLCVLVPGAAAAAEIHSVHVDREGERLLVRGSGFSGGTSFTLGGVAVPTANVSATELDIPFGAEIYSAVQWEASYLLVVDGSIAVSVYIDDPIVDPGGDPPSGGPDCPCIPGWSASGIPKDNFTWCLWGQDNNQLWMIGERDNWTISTAFDPTNIFFDPGNPGNSISYCALLDNNTYDVAEPVTNIDQYSDCENWLWINICL